LRHIGIDPGFADGFTGLAGIALDRGDLGVADLIVGEDTGTHGAAVQMHGARTALAGRRSQI
jgi:hypothetical protein